MSTAAVIVARIRNRERLMVRIAERNPDTYRENRFYISLQHAVAAYRDALAQLERVATPVAEREAALV